MFVFTFHYWEKEFSSGAQWNKLHEFIMLQALSYTAQGTTIKKHSSKIEYKLNSAQRFIY